MTARIAGIGKSLPEKVLTNADIARMVDTSDEWIVERTGIRERRIAADHETAATLGAEAARGALRTAGLNPESLELIICATCSGDGIFPATASVIQDAIGARNAAAFDVNSACAGFLSALSTGVAHIESGAYQRVLVIGAEVMSRILNWKDRNTCVLFGDGAGAIILERDENARPIKTVLKSDGSAGKILYTRGPGSSPLSVTESEGFCMVMNGPEVFKVAVRAMEDVSREALAKAGLTQNDIDYLVPHQANHRIIARVAQSLGVSKDRLIVDIEKYGNTSSASIPIALCEAWEEGRLKDGDRIVLVAVGGGLVWGASVVEWSRLACEPVAAK